MDNTVGEKLRALRGTTSLKDIASEINVTSAAICMYESGKRIPKDNIKVAIAKHYGKSVEEIFFKHLF